MYLSRSVLSKCGVYFEQFEYFSHFFNRLSRGHAHVRTSCLSHRRWDRTAAVSVTFLKMST